MNVIEKLKEMVLSYSTKDDYKDNDASLTRTSFFLLNEYKVSLLNFENCCKHPFGEDGSQFVKILASKSLKEDKARFESSLSENDDASKYLSYHHLRVLEDWKEYWQSNSFDNEMTMLKKMDEEIKVGTKRNRSPRP